MKQPPAKSSSREIVEAVVEGSVGMIPVAGSPLAVAFSLAMGWAYNRRMQVWFEEVANAISDLQDSPTIDFASLAEDEDFVDVVVAASKAAQGTRHEEKLHALRNAVVNSLTEEAPSEELRLRFIRLLADMTPTHMSLLAFLDDPPGWYDNHALDRPKLYAAGKAAIIQPAFPAMAADSDLMNRLLVDLASWGFTSQSFSGVMTAQGVWASATSPLGRAFIAFVSEPVGLSADPAAPSVS